MLPHGCRNVRNELIVDENMDYAKLSEMTCGYSGADLVLVCKEASMRPLRKLLDQLESSDNINAGSIGTLFIFVN